MSDETEFEHKSQADKKGPDFSPKNRVIIGLPVVKRVLKTDCAQGGSRALAGYSPTVLQTAPGPYGTTYAFLLINPKYSIPIPYRGRISRPYH